jgi:TRAP-type uncharacterized transport system fused permease subunit
MLIGDPLHIIWATLTATLGIVFLAAALQKCMYVKTTWYETLMFFAAALLLIKPGLTTDLLGFAFGSFAFISQTLRNRKGMTS